MLTLFTVLAFASPPSAVATGLEATVLLTTGASVCAGVVIEEDLVATAYHCISDGGRPMVQDADGQRRPGRVTAASVRDDLALVEVSTGLPRVPLADAAPAPGSTVHVLGHPFGTQEMTGGYLEGLLRFSTSSGVVSGLGPRALQTTAPVNPGNSGGPMVSEAGELVGIVSRRLRGDGLGFATRVEQLAQLLESARRPRLVGGSVHLGLTASAWGGADGTASIGGDLTVSLRDRVVLAAGGGLPVSPRWDALRFGTIRWVGAEARAGLRQRFFRGSLTTLLDAYAGVVSLTSRSGSRDSFRFQSESTVAPMAGGAVTFGGVSLDVGAVWVDGEVAVRGQMRLGRPGRLWVF
jgi:hypothetical protein